MTSVILDNLINQQLSFISKEKASSCSLVVGITAGSTVLITGLVSVNSPPGTWPEESTVLSAARKLRRKLIGNAYIVGMLFSSPEEVKMGTSNMNRFSSTSLALRSLLESSSNMVAEFYNRKSLYERCNLLIVHNQQKNATVCRSLPELRNIDHSFVDLSSRGKWMKAICRITFNTTSASLVSLEDNESGRSVHRLLEDVLISVFGDLKCKNSRFRVSGKGINVTADDSALTSLFSSEAMFCEIDLFSQPFVRSKEFLCSEDAGYFRIAAAGDLEAAVCLHSKYSTTSDLYNGLMSDIVFTLADLLSSSLKTFMKDIQEGSDSFSLLTLPKRVLPTVSLPGNGEGDLLNWSLSSYETDTAADLEYIFHRDKVMNQLSDAPKISAKPTARGNRSNRDEGVSLDQLSCSTSYGAAMFFLGGFVLVILAIFIQSFLPSFGEE